MNLAVIKIGARIALDTSSTSGGVGETLSIITMLIDGGHCVTAYSNILKNDISPENFKILEISEYYKDINNMSYDALIVLNGNANFFGGAENSCVVQTYDIINNFKGKVFYILCDPNLTLKQIWQSVKNKDWSYKYKQEDILITRNDITVLTQAQNILEVKKLVNKNVNISNVIYYPFEKFPLYMLKDYDTPKEKYVYDISYGGTFRSGKREDDMIKFYFDYPEDISVEMFGKIELKHFNNNKIEGFKIPTFSKSVKYNDFGKKMSNSLSTVIIGDKLYKKIDDLAQRIYESIRIGNIVFIDKSYDINNRIFKNKKLQKLLYVNNRYDVINKIREFKNLNIDDIHTLINFQRQDVSIDNDEYINKLTEMIKNEIS